MVTASGRAGRKPPGTRPARAPAPITTASVSRTAERPGRIRERLPARAGYIFGAGHFDSNSVAHTVGQTLAPSLIVPIAAAAEAPKFLRTAPPEVTRCLLPCVLRSSRCSSPPARSEEHTSELQSQSNLVCRLLLEKK